MLSRAVCRFVKHSPYKLRPFVNFIRGMRLDRAFQWLLVNRCKKSVVLDKLLRSAWANAKVKNSTINDLAQVYVSLAKVDQGPVVKYSLPGARGRSVLRRRRSCHIEFCLSLVDKEVLKEREGAISGSQD